MTAGDKEAGSGRHAATGTRAAGSGMPATRTARAHGGLGGDEDEEQPGGVVGGEDEEIDRTESRISQVLAYIARALVPVRETNRD